MTHSETREIITDAFKFEYNVLQQSDMPLISMYFTKYNDINLSFVFLKMFFSPMLTEEEKMSLLEIPDDFINVLNENFNKLISNYHDGTPGMINLSFADKLTVLVEVKED